MKIENIFECSEVFDATKHEKFRTHITEKCYTPWTFFISQGEFVTLPFHDVAGVRGFKIKEEAEKYRKFVSELQPQMEYIAIVLKNVDFTEGRGPMLFHKAYASPIDAHQYVVQQGGIMSSKPQGEPYISFGVNINRQLYGSINYNGYDIKLTPLCILALEQLTLRDPELRPSDRPYKHIKLGETDA